MSLPEKKKKKKKILIFYEMVGTAAWYTDHFSKLYKKILMNKLVTSNNIYILIYFLVPLDFYPSNLYIDNRCVWSFTAEGITIYDHS